MDKISYSLDRELEAVIATEIEPSIKAAAESFAQRIVRGNGQLRSGVFAALETKVRELFKGDIADESLSNVVTINAEMKEAIANIHRAQNELVNTINVMSVRGTGDEVNHLWNLIDRIGDLSKPTSRNAGE